MSSNLCYPQIMMGENLKQLNEYICLKTGAPAFFSTHISKRPHSQEPCGRLYEIITGLYIIYHDCGINFLNTYVRFITDHFDHPNCLGKYKKHYYSVKNIRVGLCHGTLPEGQLYYTTNNELNHYLPGMKHHTWPGIMSNMTDTECEHLVNQLTQESDEFVKHMRSCADKIAGDPNLLKEWRENIVKFALNAAEAKFDNRIVSDISSYWQKKYPVSKPFDNESAIKQWMTDMAVKIKNGTLTDPDKLYDTLCGEIRMLYTTSKPNTINRTKQCSADLFHL